MYNDTICQPLKFESFDSAFTAVILRGAIDILSSKLPESNKSFHSKKTFQFH